ncbi:MAG: SAM-dependent methyltransferase, partial [Lachnospiraceae bacterium]|nr:SAM-dependent methyltransferase [Lachnospiraceae bacterium]
GTARNLNFLQDNAYDLVLLMGPIYSLKDFIERKEACKEALRIANPGAPVFIALCLQDAPLIH